MHEFIQKRLRCHISAAVSNIYVLCHLGGVILNLRLCGVNDLGNDFILYHLVCFYQSIANDTIVVRDTDRNPCTTYASTNDNQPLFHIDVDQRLFFPTTRYMSRLTKKPLVKFHCTCFHRVQCYCLLKPRVKSIHRKLEMATCIGFPGQEEWRTLSRAQWMPV